MTDQLDSQAKNVRLTLSENVPLDQLVSKLLPRHYIKSDKIKDLAVESGSKGITYVDVMREFQENKRKSQRTLKYLRSKKILFTVQDLICKGIELPPKIGNRKPQRYYAASIKADIIENMKNVPVQPTGVNLWGNIILPHDQLKPLSNTLQNHKAQSFLEGLLLLPYVPLYMHKLQLKTYVDKEYFNDLMKVERPKNRAKIQTEVIGRHLVTYTISPKGTIEIAIRSSDSPFRMQSDEDEGVLFAFLGQVRDRLLHLLQDLKERAVPSVMEWRLLACDLNKDVIIDERAQMHLPDIQLKHADRVFRLYIKSLHDRACVRAEESLSLNLLLPEALENIRYPFKSVEDKMNKLMEKLDRRCARKSEGGHTTQQKAQPPA